MDVKLVMFTGAGQQKAFPINKAQTVIGRAEDCDLRAPLGNVSRRHCELTVSGGSVTVKDLASSNGTYVNNRRVNETDLSAGDRLVIGPVVFTIQIDGQPDSIQPVKTRGQILAEQGGEDIIDLEADITSRDEAPILLDDSSVGVDEIDPIAALEALAKEDDEGK